MRIRRLGPTSDTHRPANTSTLSLLRALLRECTYLPDPNARLFLRHHVILRFRANLSQTQGHQDFKEHREALKDVHSKPQRHSQLLKEAQKALRTLQRANHGHNVPLLRVLATTYGQIGRRRHTLLQSLKAQDNPTNTSEVGRVLENLDDLATQNVPQISQKLEALAKAQCQNGQDGFSLRPKLRRWKLRIPEKNEWGRPMPLRRVRNMRRKWYRMLLNAVMTPLPEGEWEYLRRMCTGETAFTGAIGRRRCAFSRDALEDGVEEIKRGDIGSQMYKIGKRRSWPHELTQRHMRRMYKSLFLQCPLMRRDESHPSGWRVEWGSWKREQRLLLFHSSAHSNDVRGTFAGVTEDGLVIGGPKHQESLRLKAIHESRQIEKDE